MKLTQTRALPGTPAYMAPEQFAGARTDARTDQFSFCVALYEALYEQRPFAGETFQVLMTSVTTGDVRPAPGQTVRSGRILARAAARDDGRSAPGRYPSMTALLAALTTDPTVRLRRAAAVAGVAVCVVGGMVAMRRASALTPGDVPGRRRAAGRGLGARGGQRSARKDAIHRSFSSRRVPRYAEARLCFRPGATWTNTPNRVGLDVRGCLRGDPGAWRTIGGRSGSPDGAASPST